MKTFSEKEEKLNSALEKLKNLNFVNPKLKEHTDYLDNKCFNEKLIFERLTSYEIKTCKDLIGKNN